MEFSWNIPPTGLARNSKYRIWRSEIFKLEFFSKQCFYCEFISLQIYYLKNGLIFSCEYCSNVQVTLKNAVLICYPWLITSLKYVLIGPKHNLYCVFKIKNSQSIIPWTFRKSCTFELNLIKLSEIIFI